MLSKEDRKAAAEKFRELKPAQGIYSVHCLTTGQTWAGFSKNLGATKNGTWFSLRNKGHREESLQQAWDAFGEAAFEFKVLETLPEDTPELSVRDLLTERRAHWVAQLGAIRLL